MIGFQSLQTQTTAMWPRDFELSNTSRSLRVIIGEHWTHISLNPIMHLTTLSVTLTEFPRQNSK